MPNEQGIKAGDTVYSSHHKQTWLVACVDGDRLFWVGWPPGYVQLSDGFIKLRKSCSDEESIEMLENCANISGDRGNPDCRASIANRQLANLPRAFVGAGI